SEPDRRPPSATVAGPRSAPFASSAIIDAELWLAARLDDFAPAVVAALGADPVREAGRVALRARGEARRLDLVLGAPLVRARVRLLLLWNCHAAGESSGL